MNKSKCCGAEIIQGEVFPSYCEACEEDCDLAPALRDSKEVLEFVEKEIKQVDWRKEYSDLNPGFFTMSFSYNEKLDDLKEKLELIKNFIERKE